MKVIAHRGNDGIHKENTMEAILNSLELPYVDGIETDIRITKDFGLVINHDPFYEGDFISKTKTKTLQQKGLNTLEEVLKRINSNKIIMIEIKEETNKYKILVSKLYKIIKKYDLNYYICSFNYELIKYFKNKYPNIKTGLIVGIKMNTSKIENDFDFNSISYRHINLMDHKETFIWTVDTKEIFDKLKPYQNIITDKAKYMSELKTKSEGQ